jgi:Bacterial aa3 type cytochrome c oxidase subunit IV
MGLGKSGTPRNVKMADHHEVEHAHGSMDIRAHEKTFAGFIRLSVWVVCISLAVLVFMALTNA